MTGNNCAYCKYHKNEWHDHKRYSQTIFTNNNIINETLDQKTYDHNRSIEEREEVFQFSLIRIHGFSGCIKREINEFCSNG